MQPGVGAGQTHGFSQLRIEQRGTEFYSFDARRKPAAGFWNPAAFAAMRQFEASFGWNDRNVTDKRMDNWGLFLGGNGLGFTVKRNDFPRPVMTGFDPSGSPQAAHVTDYQLALGGGKPGHYWGFAWGWATGDTKFLKRDDYISGGDIIRPFKYLSVGKTAYLGLHRGNYSGISDVGIRPLGNHRLTLFGDAAYGQFDTWKTMQWGAGLEVQPIDGIRLAGKVTKPDISGFQPIYSLSLGLSVDGLGFNVVPQYDKKSKIQSTHYLIRAGEQAASFQTRKVFAQHPNHVVTMPLKGELVYQRARILDVNRVALIDVMNMIEDAKNDPSVSGLALNLSQFDGSREMLWELREKLLDFKAAGKKVYMFIDRGDMTSYNFASVADYVWMDPQGMLVLPGYCAGRTFYKGLLEKIGVGVEEWRFFKYKSAFESFARKEMSDADKEQRRVLIEDFYAQWQKEIAEGRKLSADSIRKGVDSTVIFTATTARAAGLVDTLARWQDGKALIEKLTGQEPELIEPKALHPYPYADQKVGRASQGGAGLCHR